MHYYLIIKVLVALVFRDSFIKISQRELDVNNFFIFFLRIKKSLSGEVSFYRKNGERGI